MVQFFSIRTLYSHDFRTVVIEIDFAICCFTIDENGKCLSNAWTECKYHLAGESIRL